MMIELAILEERAATAEEVFTIINAKYARHVGKAMLPRAFWSRFSGSFPWPYGSDQRIHFLKQFSF